MTAEHIHDALTLLPADLITETDRKRNRKPKVIVWKRYAAMAACFALVLCGGLFCMRLFSPKGSRMESAPAEAAIMQAAEDTNGFEYEAAPAEPQAAARAEVPEAKEETLCGVPTAPLPEEGALEEAPASGANQSASTTNDQELCIDHSHIPAEAFENTGASAYGWCGNMTATLYLDGAAHSLSGSDAVTLTNILYRLDYDPAQLCRCVAEFTADTEMGTGYEISLTEYFVRFEGGQAVLTEEQADTLREIVTALGE